MSGKINWIRNIEIASICNMKCEYCLSKDIQHHRTPGLMTWETYTDTIKQLVRLNNGVERAVWLHGAGEPLLHPQLVSMIEYLKCMVPESKIGLSTNGILVTRELIEKMKRAGMQVIDVSGHNPEVAEKALAIIQAVGGIDTLINCGARDYRFNWAGQLPYKPYLGHQFGCTWLSDKECYVLHDGRVVTCCFDPLGTHVLGHVKDLESIEMNKYKLCSSCNHITN